MKSSAILEAFANAAKIPSAGPTRRIIAAMKQIEQNRQQKGHSP